MVGWNKEGVGKTTVKANEYETVRNQTNEIRVNLMDKGLIKNNNISINDKNILTNVRDVNIIAIDKALFKRKRGCENMWNSNKSLTLSCICTKLVIVLVIICALTLSSVIDIYIGLYEDISVFYITEDGIKVFSGILYACCVPALVALFSLDRMLTNIKKGQVFIQKNATYLRIISWCCFGVGVLSAIAGYYYMLFFFVAAVVAFIGLILRVVKNVIEQAIYIKAENDFTI